MNKNKSNLMVIEKKELEYDIWLDDNSFGKKKKYSISCDDRGMNERYWR